MVCTEGSMAGAVSVPTGNRVFRKIVDRNPACPSGFATRTLVTPSMPESRVGIEHRLRAYSGRKAARRGHAPWRKPAILTRREDAAEQQTHAPEPARSGTASCLRSSRGRPMPGVPFRGLKLACSLMWPFSSSLAALFDDEQRSAADPHVDRNEINKQSQKWHANTTHIHIRSDAR